MAKVVAWTAEPETYDGAVVAYNARLYADDGTAWLNYTAATVDELRALVARGRPEAMEWSTARMAESWANDCKEANERTARGECWVCGRSLAAYGEGGAATECYFCREELACLVADARAEFGGTA